MKPIIGVCLLLLVVYFLVPVVISLIKLAVLIGMVLGCIWAVKRYLL